LTTRFTIASGSVLFDHQRRFETIMRIRTLVIMSLVLVGLGPMARAGDPAPEVYDKKCKICHSIGGDGGKLADKGGPLDGVGSKHDEAWLRAYLTDPKSQLADSKMPKMKLTTEELDALVGYMLSLK
jgi:nitric oxide reductase subunit C